MKISRFCCQGTFENDVLVSRVTSAGMDVRGTGGGFLGEEGERGVLRYQRHSSFSVKSVSIFDIFVSSHLSSHMSWGVEGIAALTSAFHRWDRKAETAES